MTKPNDLAFPNMKERISEHLLSSITDGGFTKREYFAAMAMQGLVGSDTYASVARDAVTYADALINELNKGER